MFSSEYKQDVWLTLFRFAITIHLVCSFTEPMFGLPSDLAVAPIPEMF